MSGTISGTGPVEGEAGRLFHAPALRFEPDAFQMSSGRIMGRQSAGLSFLRAAVHVSKGGRLAGFGPKPKSGEAFANAVRSISAEVQPIWLGSDRLASFSLVGGIHLADPSLAAEAHIRVRAGSRAYFITGVTHTISSKSVMKMIADMAIAYIMPWDGLICTSRAVQSAVSKIFSAQEDYLRWKFKASEPFARPEMPVIPLGVHCSDFAEVNASKEDHRQKLGIDSDTIVFLFLGRLSFHAKAHPFPMYAVLEDVAKQTAKKVCLVQCGWFANAFIETAFKNAASKYCPSVNCIWLDGANEKDRAAAWAASDIFLSLSDNIQETFGLTLIEAMAASKPVVATDWDGYRDIVVHGETGFLIPSYMPASVIGDEFALALATGVTDYDRYIGLSSQMVSVDVSALRDACLQLAENPQLRRSMGDAGKRRALSNFDWSVVFDAYSQFWSELQTRRLSAIRDKIPQLRGAMADQLNPYRLFESYPTHRISPSTMIFRTDQALSIADVAKDPLFALSKDMIDPTLVERIISVLKYDEPISLHELSGIVGGPTSRLLANVAILAKMGFVSFEALTDG